MRRTYTLHSAAEKARHLKAYQASGLSVSAYARQAGLSYWTFARWARGQGLATKYVSPKKAEYLSLRKKGLTRWKACAALNVAWSSARRWDGE